MELLNPCSDASLGAQTTTFTGTAGTITGWPAGFQGVLISVDTPAYVVVGNAVTATTTNGTYVPAYTPVPFKAPAPSSGGIVTVSAILVSGSSTANLYARPINKE